MDHPGTPLIVGAGPVGLGAALFLSARECSFRIVEMRDKPAAESKALAVNPRTLELLAPTGVTRRMLEIGLRIHGVRYYKRSRAIATLDFSGIHPRYPFMLALSQATTERLLTEFVEARGHVIERGTRLVACRLVDGRVEAVLRSASARSREVVRCPWVFAADGGRSELRRQLRVPFPGSTFREQWHLADAPLQTSLAADHAHVFFFDGGSFLFLIRVVDDRPHGGGDALWRVLSNRPQPLSRLVKAEQRGPAVWASSFHVSHRVNAAMVVNNRVFFAGDAAHLHSPIGARGMNLGIEDAYAFAELRHRQRLAEYGRLRLRVVRRVVRRVRLLSHLATLQPEYLRLLRNRALPLAAMFAPVRKRVLKTVTGLDHRVPSA